MFYRNGLTDRASLAQAIPSAYPALCLKKIRCLYRVNFVPNSELAVAQISSGHDDCRIRACQLRSSTDDRRYCIHITLSVILVDNTMGMTARHTGSSAAACA